MEPEDSSMVEQDDLLSRVRNTDDFVYTILDISRIQRHGNAQMRCSATAIKARYRGELLVQGFIVHPQNGNSTPARSVQDNTRKLPAQKLSLG